MIVFTNFILNFFLNATKRKVLIILLITFYILQPPSFAKSTQNNKIPFLVQRFAEKHNCINIKKHTSFERPFYGYKGYEVFIGHSIDDVENACPILYKYGITRMATMEEYLQILGISDEPFPLSPGMWWDYYWNFKRYGLN